MEKNTDSNFLEEKNYSSLNIKTVPNYNENGIYLTSTNEIQSRNVHISSNELPDLYETNDSGYNENKLLPNIKMIKISNKLTNLKKQKNKSYSYKDLNENYISENLKNKGVSNLHPYFNKENFDFYYESCNKFLPKIDPIFKENINPKNIILKTRLYNEDENKIISELNKDEMIQRSSGNGIFMKIQKYKKLYRYHPFKLIINNLDKCKEIINTSNINNNKKENVIETKKTIDSIQLNKPKFKHLYENFSTPKRKSTFRSIKTPLIELLRNDKPPSLLERIKDENKKPLGSVEFNIKTQDMQLMRLLEKIGEKDLRYHIGYEDPEERGLYFKTKHF
jgi:hypothetical protein